MTQHNLADLKSIYRETTYRDNPDAWGNCMNWWFTVAAEIEFNRPRLAVPAKWQFQPSPRGNDNGPESFEAEAVGLATDEALLCFGMILDRYAGKLTHAGPS